MNEWMNELAATTTAMINDYDSFADLSLMQSGFRHGNNRNITFLRTSNA